MTFPRRSVIVAAVTATAILGACSNDTDNDAAGNADAAAEGGEALFERSCASCHGGDLRGTTQGPSLLSEVYEPGHHPDASFRAAIERGSPAHHWDFGDMPPVPGHDQQEIDQIINHIREQQATHGFEPYPPT